MPTWLMKTADNTYRDWSTVVDDWMSEPMTREEAVEHSNELGIPGEERVEWVDKHLCSCIARLGERVEIRDGRMVPRGGGELAYHFDSYDEVARFCRTQEELREDDDA